MHRRGDGFWADAAAAARAAIGKTRRGLAGLGNEIGRIVDRERWSAAATWRARAAAISWPRAAIAGGLAAALTAGILLVMQPDGIRAHPPRLPSEQEREAARAAAAAMQAELSPALAAANRPVHPGDAS